MPPFDEIKENIPHIIAIIALALVLLTALTKFGYMRCDDVPGFCGIYYGIFGEPKVAIVHGEGAIGKPEVLRDSLGKTTVFPTYMNIDNVQSTGILGSYDVVIVEGPKKMSTKTLRVFANYVKKGGKLVWVGDAGTQLGENDYICRQPKIAYINQITKKVPYNYSKGSYNYSEETANITECGNWVTLSSGPGGQLNDPEKLEGGICGKTFGEVVDTFHDINQEVRDDATSGELELCQEVDNPYRVKNVEGIEECISHLNSSGLEVTEENANKNCSAGNNYWNRGPSLTETGEKVQGYDFSTGVLGVQYLGDISKEKGSFELDPVNRDHLLTSGYTARLEMSYFFKNTESTYNYSKVDTVPLELRNEVVFTLSKPGGDNWPAVVVSNPTGPSIQGRGNVVYYAFPPEIGYWEGSQGKGSNLLYNLVDFMIPK